MLFADRNSIFRVRIEHRALADMIRIADEFDPKIVAAAIYGHYSEDQFTAVVDGIAPLPPDSKHGDREFTLGTQGQTEFFAELWDKSDGKCGYIGAFHSRSDGTSAPSDIDDETMRDIAADDGVQCPEPVLIVVGGTRERRVISASVYTRRHGRETLGVRAVEASAVGR